MMQQSIPHGRLVDMTSFWVVDIKTFITAMTIGTVD